MDETLRVDKPEAGCEQLSGYEHTHLYAQSYRGYERFLPCPLCEQDRLRKVIGELQTEIQSLRLSLTASEKDAARYRWLREQTERTVSPYMSCVAKYKLNPNTSEWVNVADLDASIDTAMEIANGN